MTDVGAEIAAHNADFSDIRVSLRNRLVQLGRERNHIRDSVADGHQLAVRTARDFVLPYIAI